MITDSELWDRQENDESAETPRFPRGLWDLALGIGAAVYILLELFDGVDNPLLGLLIIGVVGRRLLQPRVAKRG